MLVQLQLCECLHLGIVGPECASASPILGGADSLDGAWPPLSAYLVPDTVAHGSLEPASGKLVRAIFEVG